MSLKELGVFIATARENVDMTQAQLAQAVEISAPQVSRWERGVNLPSHRKLSRLAEVLDLCNEKRQKLFELYALASQEDGAGKVASSRRDVAAMRLELEAALGEVKRFVDTYQAFHAAYQRMGVQIDELVAEIAVIKRAVVRRPRPTQP